MKISPKGSFLPLGHTKVKHVKDDVGGGDQEGCDVVDTAHSALSQQEGPVLLKGVEQLRPASFLWL